MVRRPADRLVQHGHPTTKVLFCLRRQSFALFGPAVLYLELKWLTLFHHDTVILTDIGTSQCDEHRNK
ncbi:hypothetical protein TSMEX_008719 [Taenia solium]|eukprot:TsM_000368900 transcript=TsM_000368900 gene=TsM_000368900